MLRRPLLLALALFAAGALVHPAAARDAAKPSYPAVPLLSTGKNIVGETIRYPKGAGACHRRHRHAGAGRPHHRAQARRAAVRLYPRRAS